MNIHIQIKAYALLVIMLLGMIHHAFPHVHHSYDQIGHLELMEDSHHHDTGNHHHTEEEEEDYEEENFFEFLFKKLSHIPHIHRDTTATTLHLKTVKLFIVKVFIDHDSWDFTTEAKAIELHKPVLLVEKASDDPLLNSHQLRGPPSLG